MQKCAYLVDLEKCCRTHIYLQNFVLIQPRTSPPKFYKILLNFANFLNFANPIKVLARAAAAAAARGVHLRLRAALRLEAEEPHLCAGRQRVRDQLLLKVVPILSR